LKRYNCFENISSIVNYVSIVVSSFLMVK